MARKKSENADLNFKTRNFKLLLYPDNDQHCDVMKKIESDSRFSDYIMIEHSLVGLDQKRITEGQGKIHRHYALCFSSAVYAAPLCRELGLVSDLGEPDYQFIRPITGRFSEFLLYMLHIAYDDKEHYSPVELQGSLELRDKALKAVLRYQRSQCELPDAVLACLDWIQAQSDRIITVTDFARWVCYTPYFRAQTSPLVRGAIAEHNQKLYASVRREKIDQWKEGYSSLRKVSGFSADLDDFSDWEDFDDD